MDPEPDLIYYAVSAQVIPTLLIAFVLAVRDRPTRHGWANNWPNAVALASPLVLALAGTAAAVMVLSTGNPTDTADTLIAIGYGGVFGVFLVLILEHVRPRADPFAEESDPEAEPPAAPAVTKPRSDSQGLGLLALAAALVAVVLARRR